MSSCSERTQLGWCIAAVGFLLITCSVVWVVSSKLEAEAFNRVTGKNITTWEAMWLDLKVEEPARHRPVVQ